jgi:phage baseplate assembly protein gpV
MIGNDNMSIEHFLNIMRTQALITANGTAQIALGKITNYDPSSFSAQVQLYEGDPTDNSSQPLVTGWLPISAPAIGFNLAPNIGDLVLVDFQEGNLNNGIILLAVTTGIPTFQTPAGEWWMVHPSGSFIKIMKNGHLSINGQLEIDITAPTIHITVSGAANIAAGSVAINSTAITMGDLTHGTLSALMNGIAIGVYNSHTHNDPVSGVTGVPNQPIDPTTALTTNIQAT